MSDYTLTVPEHLWRLVAEAAGLVGQSPSAWARGVLMHRAKRRVRRGPEPEPMPPSEDEIDEAVNRWGRFLRDRLDERGQPSDDATLRTWFVCCAGDGGLACYWASQGAQLQHVPAILERSTTADKAARASARRRERWTRAVEKAEDTERRERRAAAAARAERRANEPKGGGLEPRP